MVTESCEGASLVAPVCRASELNRMQWLRMLAVLPTFFSIAGLGFSAGGERSFASISSLLLIVMPGAGLWAAVWVAPAYKRHILCVLLGLLTSIVLLLPLLGHLLSGRDLSRLPVLLLMRLVDAAIVGFSCWMAGPLIGLSTTIFGGMPAFSSKMSLLMTVRLGFALTFACYSGYYIGLIGMLGSSQTILSVSALLVASSVAAAVAFMLSPCVRLPMAVVTAGGVGFGLGFFYLVY